MSKSDNTNKQERLFFFYTAEYLNHYLPRQAGQSSNTQKQYRIGLSQFYDFIGTYLHKDPALFQFSDITHKLLLDYTEFLQNERNLAESTVNVRIIALKEYLHYMSDSNVEIVPAYLVAKRLPLLTVPKVRRPVLNKKSLKILFELPPKSRLGNRDRFILILLYDAGVRVNEIVEITLGDISIHDKEVSILIDGKGRKQRVITLSQYAAPHVIGYMKAYHQQPYTPDVPLLYTQIHGVMHRMSIRNVERIVKKYGVLAHESHEEMPDSVYPHMMRRSRFTNLYQDGVPIEQIAALAGHSSVDTTRTHYAFPADEQMHTMMDKSKETMPDSEKEWIGKTDEIKRRFGLI